MIDEWPALYALAATQPEPLPCSTAPQLYGNEPDSYNDKIAKVLCSGCPILLQCRAYAIDSPEWGVWGGLTEEERRKQRRSHRTECGTKSGYNRHKKMREPQCEKCLAWSREQAEAKRAKNPPKKRPRKAECGTRSAYQTHLRNNEECDVCKEAERLRGAARRQDERQQKEALAA